MEYDIVTEDSRWAAVELQEISSKTASALAEIVTLPVGANAAILACNDQRIATLNADFRGKPQPTNVLSWPSEDLAQSKAGATPRQATQVELGDIALAFETCKREAEETGKCLRDHLSHLILHGTLHLLGYDHETDADAALMEELEVEILTLIGIKNPYMID